MALTPQQIAWCRNAGISIWACEQLAADPEAGPIPTFEFEEEWSNWPSEVLKNVGQPFAEVFETVRVATTGVLIGAVLVLGAVLYLGRR